MSKACDQCYLNFKTIDNQIYCKDVESYVKPIDKCAGQVLIGHAERFHPKECAELVNEKQKFNG